MTRWRTSSGDRPGGRVIGVPSTWRRSPLAAVLLLAWLGGGLLSAAMAAVVDGPNDLLYAAVNTALASFALLALPFAAPRLATARRPATPVRAAAGRRAGTVAARVPAQATTPACNSSSAPATA